jgi:iron complex transport system substrate-binding protein
MVIRETIVITAALACLISLLTLPAFAQASGVPGDSNGDKIVSDDELKAAEQLNNSGKLSSDELQKIKHIHDTYPRTIKDSAGKEITIYKPISRLAVLTNDDYEIVRTLNATDKVVAVNMYVADSIGSGCGSLYLEGSRYANIGNIITSVDYETLIKADPDAIITYLNSPKPGEMEKKIRPDIPVIHSDAGNISEYTNIINKTGYLLEKEDEARNYISFFDNTLGRYLQEVRSLPENEKPRVYLETDFGSGQKYNTVGPGNAHNALIVAAGSRNIFSNITGSKQIDPESVVTADPQIILYYKYMKNSPGIDKDLSNTTALVAVRDEIMNRSELKNVEAVKDKKVFVFTWDCTRGGGRFYLGIGYLGKWLQPSIFKDYNPREAYQEYLKRFQEVDVDVLNRGVFVYPEA